MPIDPSIALQIKAPQFDSPVNALGGILQLQNAQQQNKLGQMQLTQQQTGIDRTNRLNALLSGFKPDASPDDQVGQLTRGGFLPEARTLAESSSKVAKEKRDAEKAQLEGQLKKFEVAGQIMSGVSDQASWERARQQTAQVFGPEAAAQMPPQYDPALIEQKRMQALTVKDQLEQKWKAMEYTTPKADAVLSSQTSIANNTATNATSRANNAATVGATIRGQNMSNDTTRRGQDLTDGRAKDKLAQDGSGVKLTEDQGKATGWLVQADNAYKNMMAVGADKQGNPTSAAKPGINDAIGAVPLLGGLANSMRGADRQKFMQASSSLSESLLRAATGAGVNKDEAEQKIRELTPQYGEAPEVTKQKYDAIPLYIESLKVRAGPGAKKAAAISGGGSSSTIDDLVNKYK